MMKLPPPITQNTFISIVSQWANITKRNDSASILNLSNREQLWRINQLLQDKEIVKLFSPSQIIVINLVSLPFDETEELESYLAKKRDKNKGSVVLFILSADRLLDEKQSLLAFFNSLPHRNEDYKVLFFFQKNILLSHHVQKLSSFSTLYQNICPYPFYENPDQLQFIDYLEEKFKVKLPINVIKKIVINCGGHLWLIKEAVRYYMYSHDESGLFSHAEMRLRLEILFNEFDDLEKKVLEKLTGNNLVINEKEKKIIDYFVNIKLLKLKNNKYFFTIPILADYVREQASKKNGIHLNELHQLTLNGITIEEYFTVREKRLLKFFLLTPKIPISRDKTASIIWKQENYTDWALDQFIKRLRKKLVLLGLNKNTLITKRNQGYMLHHHSIQC